MKPRPDKPKPKPAHVVKVGRTEIPVYKLTRRGSARVSYQFRYYVAGVPERLTRATLAKAIEAAEQKAHGIENGRVQAGDLSAADVHGYVHALATLAELGEHAPPLHVALEEYVAARKLLPPGGSLTAAAAALAQRQTDAGHRVPPAQILERFLLALGDHAENPRHLRGRRHDLARFLAWLPAGKLLADVSADEIQVYLRALMAGKMSDQWNGKLPPKGTWPAVGPRRRDNIRDGISELFHFAKRHGHLPADRDTQAGHVRRIGAVHEIKYYTPEQLVGWLVHVKEQWLPWFVLCAFCGLRSTEVVGDPENPRRPRLHWEHFRWEQGYIVVPKTTARKINRARRAHLPANAQAWLLRWRNAQGPLYPDGSDQEQETDRLQKKLKRAWDNNALRHSFGTHRNPQLGNAGALAEEMGTSVTMIRRYYDAVPADVDPAAYFGIMPGPEAETKIVASGIRRADKR